MIQTKKYGKYTTFVCHICKRDCAMEKPPLKHDDVFGEIPVEKQTLCCDECYYRIVLPQMKREAA